MRRLFALETLALVIPNFVQSPEPLADAIQEAGETARNWSVTSARGMESSDVKAVGGTPYNVAVSTNDIERYFAEDVPNAKKWVRSLPGGDALDRLRCDLDDAWPGGCSAKRMRRRARPYWIGKGRRADPVAGCTPTNWRPLLPKAHFSANLYLKLPRKAATSSCGRCSSRAGGVYANAHLFQTRIDEEAQRSCGRACRRPVLEVAPASVPIGAAATSGAGRPEIAGVAPHSSNLSGDTALTLLILFLFSCFKGGRSRRDAGWPPRLSSRIGPPDSARRRLRSYAEHTIEQLAV